MYKQLIRPILFSFKPEQIHCIVFNLLHFAERFPPAVHLIKKLYQINNPKLCRTIFGITFPNPVGLAAGLDKDAEAFDMLGNLGFGFVEIGTVTPKEQPGNPKPRLFRLKRDEALINRMGFNNKGLEHTINMLKRKKTGIIIGGNIGRNKITDNENAIYDYEICFNSLFPYVDYFVVNVSSPNTPNLRALQEKEPLTQLLSHLNKINSIKTKRKPILLKIAPDLTNKQLDDIIEIVQLTAVDGIVATNTTISRDGISLDKEEMDKIGNGGLSGKPLSKRSTEVIKYIYQKSNGLIPIIGVGGIMHPEDAVEKIEAGASLVQLYTGFIYEGPELIKKINKALLV